MTVRIPAIQSLISPHVASVYTSQIPVDWAAGKVYPYDTGTHNVSRVGISSGAVEQDSIFEPPDFFSPPGVDRAGVLYNKPGTGNFSSVLATLGSDFTFLGTFGSSNAGDNQPDSIPGPMFFFANSMAPDIIYIATAASIPFGTAQHSINILRGGGVPTFGGHNFQMLSPGAGASASQCPGPASSSSCSFFTVETVPANDRINIYTTTIGRLAITYDPAAWPTPNPGIATVHTGTLLPTAINPAYDQIIQSGVIWDQTDGNMIMGVNAGTGGIPDAYIVKVTPAGVLRWAVPWHGAPLHLMMGQGICRHGIYAVMFCNSFDKSIIVINTADGSVETIVTNVQGIGVIGQQCYNDELGCIIAYVDSFSANPDGPIPLGNTPNSFAGWAAIYVTNREVPYIPGGRVAYTRIWGAPAGIP